MERQLRIVRAGGEETPFNAGDAVAAAIEVYGMPIPGQIKARLGKGAKELLKDGFEPETVVAAVVAAIRMARPHLVASFGLEIQTAKAGVAVDWGEYRNAIRRLNAENKPQTAIDMAFEKMRRGELR